MSKAAKGDLEEILSEKQAILFALLEKTREKVRFITDEEADEVLRALYTVNRTVLQRLQASHRTPTKKLVQMSMDELLKLVESEHLVVSPKRQRKKREERSERSEQSEPPRKSQGKPPKKARDTSRQDSKSKEATVWDAEKVRKKRKGKTKKI